MRALDLTGHRFGAWTALEPAFSTPHGVYWRVRCDCGALGEVRAAALRNGRSTCCGRCDAKPEPEPTDDLPAPKVDHGRLLEAVNRLRANRQHMSIERACAALGVAEWNYFAARRHVATDEEAFEFSWHERITADEKITKGGA